MSLVIAVSIAAFTLASVADLILYVQTRQHRKDTAANEASIRQLRQEVKNDFDALRSQVCSVIEFADKEVRADLSEYVGAVKQSILAETSHSISGNADCPEADILLLGPVQRATKADAEGFYSFAGLPSGTYTIRPSTSKPGKTFSPKIQVVVIDGADVIADFLDPSSPVDSRVSPISSRNVQGNLIYDVPSVDSRAQGASIDCRVTKPMDCRVSPNIPQNSRS